MPLFFKDKMAAVKTFPYFTLQQIQDFTEFQGHNYLKSVLVSDEFCCDDDDFVIKDFYLKNLKKLGVFFTAQAPRIVFLKRLCQSTSYPWPRHQCSPIFLPDMVFKLHNSWS